MYFLVLIGVIISLFAQIRVSSSFKKYSKVRTESGLSGAEVAEYMLAAAGIRDVRVERISGNLTDHYDPSAKVLRLSEEVYAGRTVAAAGVAAHECGHAIQDAEGYSPMRLRASVVPVANIGSKLSIPLIFLGLFLGGIDTLVIAGILMFAAVVIFHLVTLPVEFDASSRAVRILDRTGILRGGEVKGARKVLSAAGFTYVASTLVAVLQLLRLMSILNSRD